jgi:peptide/nickel transport system substrate-binding protein
VGIRRDSEGRRKLPSGEPFKIEVNCVAGWSDWILAAQIIVRNFEAVGISAELRTYGFGAYFERLQEGNYDLSMSWSSGGATPYGFYQRQMSSHSLKPIGVPTEHNWQRVADKQTDALLAEFESTSDPKRQWELSAAMQLRFVRVAPSIPLFPGPAWGQYNTTRFKGFPTKENPYAPLSPFKIAGLPNYWLVLLELEPR